MEVSMIPVEASRVSFDMEEFSGWTKKKARD